MKAGKRKGQRFFWESGVGKAKVSALNPKLQGPEWVMVVDTKPEAKKVRFGQ